MQKLLKKQQVAIAKLTTALAKVTGQKAATVKAKNKQEAASASSVKRVNHYQYGDKDTGYFAKIAPVLMAFFIFFFVFLIFGYLLGYGLLCSLQAVVICRAGIYILNIEIVGSLAAVVTVCVLFAFVALAFVLLLSTFAESEFQMMQFIPLIVVPQVFFSGIVPLSSMAGWVQALGKILPLTYAGDAMTGIIMKGQSLAQVSGDLAAIELFSQQGFDGTSTAQIAEKAGVSQATIFRYYKTKEDLLNAAIEPIIR